MKDALYVWGSFGEDGKFVRREMSGGGYGMVVGELPSNISPMFVVDSALADRSDPNWVGWWRFPLKFSEYVGTKFGLIRVGSPHLLRTIVEEDDFVLTEKFVGEPLLLTLALDAKEIANGHGHGRYKSRPKLGAFRTEELRVVTVRVETTYHISHVETPHVIPNLEG